MGQPEATRFKIAILRALQLGDLLCSVPAFRALRHAYPHAEITLLGLPWAATFVERFNSYLDRFIHFPGFPGLPEQPYSPELWRKFVQTMEEEEFDLVIQMQGNGTIVNPMLQDLNLTRLAGYYPAGEPVEAGTFMEYPDDLNEIERHLKLMQHLGVEPYGSGLEFPLTAQDEADLKKLLLPVYEKRYVVIHPGSRGAWRQWPPVYFAALADYCIEKGYTAVITGVKDELDITKEVIKCMKHAPIDLTGKTTLGAVGLLIKNAFMLISNCTGVSHIAAAFETPSVVISMNGEPQRWAPQNKDKHVVLDWLTEPHFEKVFEATVEQIRKFEEPVSFKTRVSVPKNTDKVHYFYS